MTRSLDLRAKAAPAVSLSIFVVLWQLLSVWLDMKAFPGPVRVLQEGWAMFHEDISGYPLWMHAYFSLRRVLSAYLLAAVTGIPLGVGMGWNRTFDKVVKPVFELLRPIPPIAWIPLAILWLGIGEGPKIFICYVGAFVIFVLNSYTGMRYTDRLLLDASMTFGASRRQQLFNVALPASMPSIFAGVQNALSMAWMCVVAAELVGAREGVGFIIVQGMDLNNSPMIIVGMILIGLIGLFFATSLRIAERMICPWRTDIR
jgi:NitT/TauT family transport system permease protein/sulfonate transport system permease protein